MWIFQDMKRAWEDMPEDPGSAEARWEFEKNSLRPCLFGSCFWPYYQIYGVFISDGHAISSDIVIHELSHHYMYNAMGWWYWKPDTWLAFAECIRHPIFRRTNRLCAWTEGWADFIPLAVNEDTCFDWGRGPCGADGFDFRELETPTWGNPSGVNGDEVEGRVAGALYDLFDGEEDGWDEASFGLEEIWEIVSEEPDEESFLDFWERWKEEGYDKHLAVQCIYQNTIDYNNPPVISGLPDLVLFPNNSYENIIDLWEYSSDEESEDEELRWEIHNVTDRRCGVSIDGRYVDIFLRRIG
jgi:hypothetical protein